MLSLDATVRQKQSTYAITILTFQRHRHFQRTANAELLITTLFQHRDKSPFELHGFAVMPDHVHVLITPAINQSIARCIQYIKGGYSFAVRKQSTGEIWHTGYHEHRVRDADDFNSQLLYIQNNPARKQYQDYPHVHTRYLTASTPSRASCFLSQPN
ncbi:MAG TPA: transposase [Edaphobacter sp.]|nr:transposase [Edaphobacter sp.]